MFYVYEHIRPDTNQVFYVGKGSGNRCNVKQNRNSYWKNIVAKSNKFIVNKIAKNLDSELAFLVEQERINQLKRLGYKLCNLTDGGEGGENPSKETKLKMSEAHIGEKNPRFNKNSIRQKKLRGELKVSKEIISENMKANHWSKTGVYIPKKGIKKSEIAKLRMQGKRQSVTGGNNPKAKRIIYNEMEFLCIKDFASFLNVNYKTLVQKIRAVKRTVFTTEDFDSLTNGQIAFN